ncbi:uncharacterized protein LOC135804716 [Sycon ciliatum]|uniref:uncharacterized protein LOC135804716 n=1 Tax=Sycon ciliatum TaxID=27933 RepID=UPI0031F6B144
MVTDGRPSLIGCSSGMMDEHGSDESATTVAALRSEIAKLKRDLSAAWSAELQMVNKARVLAQALAKQNAAKLAIPEVAATTTHTNGGGGGDVCSTVLPDKRVLSDAHPARTELQVQQQQQQQQQVVGNTNGTGTIHDDTLSANRKRIKLRWSAPASTGSCNSSVTSDEDSSSSIMMKRQRTIPTNLFDLSHPGKMISIQECAPLVCTDEATTPGSTSISSKLSIDSSDSVSSSSGSSSSGSSSGTGSTGIETGTGRTEDRLPLRQRCHSPRSSRRAEAPGVIAPPKTERKNGLVLYSPTTPPSPGSERRQSAFRPGCYEEIKEHALRLVQLLPGRDDQELPAFLQNHQQLDILRTGLLNLVNHDDDGDSKRVPVGKRKAIPSLSLDVPAPSVSKIKGISLLYYCFMVSARSKVQMSHSEGRPATEN